LSREKPNSEDVYEWVRELLSRHGYRQTTWPDGSVGIINASSKFCAVVGDMTSALQHLAEGDPLPAFVGVAVKPKPQRRRKHKWVNGACAHCGAGAGAASLTHCGFQEAR
jgi:hypothetical protein